MKEILQFLKELEANNNRDWFDANRTKYEQTRKQFLDYTAYLINEIRKFDNDVPLLRPIDCAFRIFRDVRFSNDKRPYKTNYGSYIAKGGRKSGYAGYYLNLQPGDNFLAGGVYMPPPDHLHSIRQEIFYHPEEYLDLMDEKGFRAVYTNGYTDPLKTAPKGYPKDWPHIELIKNRSYAFGKPLSDDMVCKPDFLSGCVESFKLVTPYNRFINKAIEDNKSE